MEASLSAFLTQCDSLLKGCKDVEASCLVMEERRKIEGALFELETTASVCDGMVKEIEEGAQV